MKVMPSKSADEDRRVLFCIPTMKGGGAERQLGYLASGLSRMGWNVKVAMLSAGENTQRLIDADVPIKYIRHKNHYDPRIILQLATLMKSFDPHLVHSFVPMMNIYAGFACAIAGVRHVGSERSVAGAHEKRIIHERLRQFVYRRWLTALIANSASGLGYWKSILSDSVPCYEIRNTIPVEEIDAIPPAPLRQYDIDDNQPVVMFVGRLVAAKNLQTLFSTLKSLFAKHPTIVAVIAGEGPERQKWQAWAQENNLSSRIIFLGYVTNVWSYLKRADVFLFPSLFEGQPNAVMEAMACRCPLVVSNIEPHREFLDENCAIFAEPLAVDDFVNGVLNVLDNQAAAEERAKQAYAWTREQSLEPFLQEHIRVYEEILQL